ncbi:uncharacterized protein LOC110024366 isoform X3 [Phalaenopsis equestris]|uniref:uncharacterized protein LOC110024366 isoform X3 n=1 Tax=Phalaenopsis equestris TaxID=78828 RepID=UPI0009E53FD9|nr:uncharacterized protein LOC110024366 isoform X3 [Phalaenopsis equestris]
MEFQSFSSAPLSNPLTSLGCFFLHFFTQTPSCFIELRCSIALLLFHRENYCLMATALVSRGLSCSYSGTSEHGRTSNDLSFSCSISSLQLLKCDALSSKFSRSIKIFRSEVRKQESDKLGINGRSNKMVSTKKLAEIKSTFTEKIGTASVSAAVNGSKGVVNNGAGLVKMNGVLDIAKTPKKKVADDLSSGDELKVFASDEGFSWANENYNGWQRTIDIWSFVISLRIRVLFDNAKWAYLDGITENKQKKRRQKTAAWCRERVLQLGPTFIKLGQLSSTRSDLFPKEFVDELAKLQVHQAILHTGENVIIKVQRPGLKRLFDIDLRNLKLLAEYFQKSETFGGPTRDWIGIYEECSKILFQEIDYVNEGRNADKFRRDFRNVKWVRVPIVLWDYTSMKVLTLEYVPGIKINNLSQIDVSGINRSLIASRAIEAYLIQLLKTGFFHADPHPGNLAIDKDGSLIYYDFGMMGEIKSFTRERLLDLFYSVYEKDANKVMRNLIEIEALKPTGDMSSVRRSIQFFLDNLLSQSPDQQQTLAAIGEDLFAIATDQPFRFPATFTFVLRAFSTLEGIGYTLDPEFSFVKVAAPYAKELLDIRQKQPTGAELVNQIRRQANDARDYTISMPYRIQKVEEFVKQLESGDLKLRVRVLESERAARKATILQMATIYTALGGTLFNVGVNLSGQGNDAFANGAFIGAGIFSLLLARSLQRVKKLDKFEKML